MGLFNGALDILLVLLILVVLVVIHEFGHFITARRAGVRVHEFGIGFPPRARILGRDSETIYTLNWLPLGGFVRLEGEEGESEDPRSFIRQPLRTRLWILAAGVLMNFLLAVIIFTGIAWAADPITNVAIGCVVPGSPAESIGLIPGRQIDTTDDGQPICDQSGDVILAMDGRRFPTFDSVDQADAPLAYLRAHAGQPVVLTIRHPDGAVEDKTVTLAIPSEGRGALGITSFAFTRDEVTREPLEAIATGIRRTVDASTLILRGLRDLITNIANPQVSGPIGIVSAVGAVRSDLPPVFMVWLIGVLSANLAVINILPLPPMDGGKIAISLIQRVSGNRISAELERAVYLAGFVLLMSLILWISLFDTGILQRQIGS